MKLRRPYKYFHLIQGDRGMKIVWLILCFAGPVILFPQSAPTKFEYLTTNDGLSHNYVSCMLQDKQGYMWFGTAYGLNRYDGYEFKVFKNIPGDSTSITHNRIFSLCQDKNGIIWVGEASALNSYDPHTETFRNYTLPAETGFIHDIKEDEDGLLWLATGNGLFSFDSKSHQQKSYATHEYAKDYIQSICPDKNHDIWLATFDGIRRFNTKTHTVKAYHLPLPAAKKNLKEITSVIISDSSGQLWISTWDLGLYRFNPLTEKFTRYINDPSNPSGLPNNTSYQMMEDTNGKIWIGNDAGLIIFDPVGESLRKFKLSPQDVEGSIYSLLKDRSGIYWVGSAAGIVKYDPKLPSFRTSKPNPNAIHAATTIIEDTDHQFWVGNYDGFGLINVNTAAYTRYRLLPGDKKSLPVYCSLPDDDGTFWLGSHHCIFHMRKNKNGKKQNKIVAEQIMIPFPGITGVMALAKDQNNIWIGMQGAGLFRYNLFSKTFTTYQKNIVDKYALAPNVINCLHFISKDSLLIGAEEEELILMHMPSEKFERINFKKHKDVSNAITDIHEDSKHNIWIATANAGLWQTDASLTKFRNYTVKDGLKSMNITQITEDKKGQIWLNTNLGLEVIDLIKKRFTNFSAKDGLSTLEPDYLIKTSSGDLMRIDFAGLHIFQSASINRNTEKPPVYIKFIQVSNKIIPVMRIQ